MTTDEIRERVGAADRARAEAAVPAYISTPAILRRGPSPNNAKLRTKNQGTRLRTRRAAPMGSACHSIHAN